MILSYTFRHDVILVCPELLMQQILTFLLKIHIANEAQFKILTRKISLVTLFKQYHFSLVKIHRDENIFLTEIYNEICYCLFSIQWLLGKPRKICSTLLSRSAAKQNSCGHRIFWSCIGKPMS